MRCQLGGEFLPHRQATTELPHEHSSWLCTSGKNAHRLVLGLAAKGAKIMGYAPASSVHDFWVQEVLPRERDFLLAERAVAKTNDPAPACRRAIDTVSVFAAFSDIVAAKERNWALPLIGYAPSLDMHSDQRNLRKKIADRFPEFKALTDLWNTYKHGILIGNDRPEYNEASVSVTVFVAPPGGYPIDASTSIAGSEHQLEPPNETIYKLWASWRESGSDHQEKFSTLFSKAKAFWTDRAGLQLPADL